MKKIITLLFVLCGFVRIGAAQVTLPYTQGFEDSFTEGTNVEFITDWWANLIAADTMYQETTNVHSGSGALAAIPFGEEEFLYAYVHLDLTDKSNAYATFWAASESTGGSKSSRLLMSVSIDDGVTWTPMVEIGDHSTFPNDDTPYAQYTYALNPISNGQPDVILRFAIRPGIMQEPAAKILIDDVEINYSEEDIFKPVVLEPDVLSADSIELIFSEPVSETAEDIANYIFSPIITVSSATRTATLDTVYLVLTTPLESGVQYALTISNIEDLNGNVMDVAALEVIYNDVTEGLVITEILYDSPPPEQRDYLEYIELYNATCEPMALGGIQLKEAIFSGPLPQYILQPGEYYVMTIDNSYFLTTFGYSANYEWVASNLDNAGDYLELLPAAHHAGFLLDSVVYSIAEPWPTDANGTGRSIELLNAFLDNSDGANWVSSQVASGNLGGNTIWGTPGHPRDESLLPVVNIGPDGNRCGVTEVVLDAGNEGSKYLWSTGEETQTITVTSSGTYSVVVNNGIGAAYDTIEVNLVPAIVASAIVPVNACAFTSVSFTDSSTDAVSWSWDFGDEGTSTLQNPDHIFSEAGIYTVTLTVQNSYGCSDVFTGDIEILENNIQWILPETLCEGTEALFTDNTSSAQDWLWDFGDGNTSVEQNATHTYLGDGNYTVSLTINNSFGCNNTASQEVVVHANTVDWTLPENICQGSAASFADISIAASEWLWDFGDGNTSTEQNPDHTYALDGDYTITLTVTNSYGCISSANQEIVVNPNPLTWTLPVDLCQNIEANFEATSASAVSWLWDFGDGNTSTEQNPAHAYTNGGNYTVSVEVTNSFGCVNTLTDNLHVNPNRTAWILPEGICQGTEVSFMDDSNSAISWLWDFGDDATSTVQNPVHTYLEAGSYDLSLTTTNSFGCTSTITTTIDVNPNTISWTLPSSVCEDTEAEFEDNSDDAVSWLWDFGDDDTSSDQNPSHVYADAGTYTVSLTVINSYGCDVTVTDEITVNAFVIDWEVPEEACANTEVMFEDNTLNATAWLWDFGDDITSAEQNPSHTYESDGSFTVTLTVTNSLGCTMTVTEDIEVSPNKSGWSLPTAPVCTYTDLQFGATAGDAISWNWDFGDENTSNLQNPVHIYSEPGTYMVKLTVTNSYGCEYTLREMVEVGICVGMDDQTLADQVTLYPNPSNGMVSVNLDWSITGNPVFIQILNIRGEAVYAKTFDKVNGNTQSLDVSQLGDGLYIVCVRSGSMVVTQKLIIGK